MSFVPKNTQLHFEQNWYRTNKQHLFSPSDPMSLEFSDNTRAKKDEAKK